MNLRHLFILTTLAMLAASCGGYEANRQESLAEISKQELATALKERDQLLSLVKEVTAGLNEIKQLEKDMDVDASPESQGPVERARLLADIAGIKEKIEQRKKQLNDLEEKLQESTINNNEVRETIDAFRTQIDAQLEEIEMLRKQLVEANAHIGILNNTVDSLNLKVTAVTSQRNKAREISTKLNAELNTCYYVVATKADLKKRKIIESGFLRKTRFMKGNFDKCAFMTGDKRTLRRIPLGSRKARLLSNHPVGTYEITEGNGEKILNITVPEKFWSLSNYLVVQVD